MDLIQLSHFLSVALPIAREALMILTFLMPRTVVDLLLWQLVYLPLMLAVVYPWAIRYERGGWWRLLFPVYAGAGLLSAWLNYTTFVLYFWDTPRKGENTLSQRLERLVFDGGRRGSVARAIARFTNRYDPTPPHIPLPGASS